MKDSLLLKATRLLGARQYTKVIRLLEPEIVNYHDSFRYFHLLSLACLYSADYGGALTYLRKAREMRMRDPDILNGLAALFVKRGESTRAIEYYLDVLDVAPTNKIAKKALRILKTNGSKEALSKWLEKGKLSTLFPPLPLNYITVIRVVILVCIVLGSILSFYLVNHGDISFFPFRKDLREGTAVIVLEKIERQTPVQVGGTFRYILSSSEVISIYDRALSLFQSWRDEAAKVELNKILLSNASDAIKNKAMILYDFLRVPGFDTLHDRYTWAEVSEDPEIFNNVYVIFRGLSANLRYEDKNTYFDLLVGYDTKTVLQGILPVLFKEAVSLDPAMVVEILGKLIVIKNEEGKNVIYLEGLAIHQSKLLQQ
jgi:tetratricopeptide (TPR) repeat protein